MAELPDAIPQTATYAAQVLAFQEPILICDIPFELDRGNYEQRLRIANLPGQLEEFLAYAFAAEALMRCGIYGSIIYFGTTPNIPGTSEPARPADALEAMWQALTRFTRQEFPRPDWKGMRERITLRRGEGLDLGETGVYMARMMDLVCGVSSA